MKINVDQIETLEALAISKTSLAELNVTYVPTQGPPQIATAPGSTTHVIWTRTLEIREGEGRLPRLTTASALYDVFFDEGKQPWSHQKPS